MGFINSCAYMWVFDRMLGLCSNGGRLASGDKRPTPGRALLVANEILPLIGLNTAAVLYRSEVSISKLCTLSSFVVNVSACLALV